MKYKSPYLETFSLTFENLSNNTNVINKISFKNISKLKVTFITFLKSIFTV